MLTFPRELTLDHQQRLTTAPASELAALRGTRPAHRVTGAEPASVRLGPGPAKVVARLPVTEQGTTRLTLDCDGSEVLSLAVGEEDAGPTAVWESTGPHEHTVTRWDTDDDGPVVTVRVFVDGSLAEGFAGHLPTCTTRAYPASEGSWSVRVDPGETALPYGLTVWELSPQNRA